MLFELKAGDSSKNQVELFEDENHKPIVRFHDSWNNALVFSFMFWTSDFFGVERVKSQLRYKIFHSFRKNKISISFPQMDVHIIQF
jgi:small-conductance mechanosensitive channel